jgi:hypothetical protein
MGSFRPDVALLEHILKVRSAVGGRTPEGLPEQIDLSSSAGRSANSNGRFAGCGVKDVMEPVRDSQSEQPPNIFL